MDIKVSIIIPVYNVASYLDACLSSCVNQTFHEIEIIVVDDGSTDESPGIIQKYAKKDDRIKVITKQNEGLIFARKSGLEVACGEYVFHLDGDDYIEIRAIEELYKEAVESEADYVIGNFSTVSGDNKCQMESINVLSNLSGEDLLLSMLQCKIWPIWGKLIKKSYFADLFYLPVTMGEDLFFNMQICLKVKKTSVVDASLYNYVIRTGSVTNQKNRIIDQSILDMMKAIFSLLDRYSYNQLIKENTFMIFYLFILNSIRNKNMEIKEFLYDYYWNNQEVKSFLWRDKKHFYLIIKVFFVAPFVSSIMANIYLLIIVFKKKCNMLKNK